MNILKVENINKSFNSNKVLNNLSFNVKKNSVFGFLGENGSGKTTTMKIIMGLLKADSGNVKVFNETVKFGQTKTNRHIGYLPDIPAFYDFMNGKEYLNLCGKITNMTNNEINSKSENMLKLVGLNNINKKIKNYSRGMKQRLGIAQALLNSPKLLICDEPTSALDPIGRKEILDILSYVSKETTVVFSTHILSDVERICSDIALLHNGSIALKGSMEEIKAKKASNTLILKFSTVKEIEDFIKGSINTSYHKNIQSEHFEISIQSENIKSVEAEVISVLNNNKLLPGKLEVIEPTLESLFMEVVR